MAMSKSARENAATLRKNLEDSGVIAPPVKPVAAAAPAPAVAPPRPAANSDGFVTSALAASYCTRTLDGERMSEVSR